MEPQESYPPGTAVMVWIGAFTGSPGVPPAGARGIPCRVSHWNGVGQAFVNKIDPRKGPLSPAGNTGMYVFGPAILGRPG